MSGFLIVIALVAPIVAFRLGVWWEWRKWRNKTINWNRGFDSGYRAGRSIIRTPEALAKLQANSPAYSARRNARTTREIAELEDLHKKEDRRTK